MAAVVDDVDGAIGALWAAAAAAVDDDGKKKKRRGRRCCCCCYCWRQQLPQPHTTCSLDLTFNNLTKIHIIKKWSFDQTKCTPNSIRTCCEL